MSAVQGTALVTGASSGIGEIYAERLAKRGYDLILVGRSNERLAALSSRLASTGRRIELLAADLAQPADRAKVEAVLRNDPTVTLLVNSAGLLARGGVADTDPAALDEMLAVNVMALTGLSAAAAGQFTARGRGGIINVASVMAFIDTPATAAYGASKAYVLNFTLGLDLELRDKGVKVQAVLPGYTRTAMIAHGAGLPPQAVMDAGEMVDAALVGFDRGELVTIPSLPDAAEFGAWLDTRTAMQPRLSLDHAAQRYGVTPADAAA